MLHVPSIPPLVPEERDTCRIFIMLGHLRVLSESRAHREASVLAASHCIGLWARPLGRLRPASGPYRWVTPETRTGETLQSLEPVLVRLKTDRSYLIWQENCIPLDLSTRHFLPLPRFFRPLPGSFPPSCPFPSPIPPRSAHYFLLSWNFTNYSVHHTLITTSFPLL